MRTFFRLQAQYASVCAHCPRPIAVGDEVAWRKHHRLAHVDCELAALRSQETALLEGRVPEGLPTFGVFDERERARLLAWVRRQIGDLTVHVARVA